MDNLLSTSGRGEALSKVLEAPEVLAELDVWNVHNDVE